MHKKQYRNNGVVSPSCAILRLRRLIPHHVMLVIERLRSANGEAFLVGGVVRDAFLGIESNDWDIATNLLPTKVASLFSKVIRSGEKHGTITVVCDNELVEVTTYRSDGKYEDQRRPSEVIFHGNIAEDLKRRDFTINALAVDIHNGVLVDPCNGFPDLQRRLLRCVGDPLVRFSEDGLRILRAVRIAHVLNFNIETKTKAAIPQALNSFLSVSWERKRDEMTRILRKGKNLSKTIKTLYHCELITDLAPELASSKQLSLKKLDLITENNPWLRFATWATLGHLSPEKVEAVLRRWRVATDIICETKKTVQALSMLPGNKPPKGADLRRWLSCFPPPVFVNAAKIAGKIWPAYKSFPATVKRLLNKKSLAIYLEHLAINGHTLLSMGYFGRDVGTILGQLLQAVIANPKLNTEKKLILLAHRLSTGKT